MRDETIIRVEHLSKKYCKELRHTMLYGVQDIARNAIGLSSDSGRIRNGEFWALDDVSFEVKRGETLGIIGANGSGKTTLLKLLNGILMPDKGRIEIRGKVGGLIEIGAGFHPMLTGRENIYVNGTILGMSKKEIDKKFDEIVDFADICEFIDSPVKHYSSGMYVRLGFAIAVHCEPDILLIDEVLAVGDEQFQRRCVNQINSLQENGKTIVFVSHTLITVEGLCSKAVWMEKGKINSKGSSKNVIDEYLFQVGKTLNIEGKRGSRRWGTREAEIVDMGLFDGSEERINRVVSGEETILSMNVRFKKQIENPIFGIIIKDNKGNIAYGINSRWRHITLGIFEEGEEVNVKFKQRMQLNGGLYQIDGAVAYSDGITFCDWQENAYNFIVEIYEQSTGVANLNSQITIEKINNNF